MGHTPEQAKNLDQGAEIEEAQDGLLSSANFEQQMAQEPYDDLSPEDIAALEEVGRSFRDTLLNGLPEALQDLATYFSKAGVTAVDDEEYEEFLIQPDVIEAGEKAHAMARYGIRPIDIDLACEEVSAFLSDLIDDAELDGTKPIAILPTDSTQSYDTSSVEHYEPACAISRVTGLDNEHRADDGAHYKSLKEIPFPRSTAILNWLRDASRTKPFLFEGWRAEVKDDALILHPFQKIESEELRRKLTAADKL